MKEVRPFAVILKYVTFLPSYVHTWRTKGCRTETTTEATLMKSDTACRGGARVEVGCGGSSEEQAGYSSLEYTEGNQLSSWRTWRE